MPLYKLDNNYPVERTQKEIEEDRAKIPNEPATSVTDDSVWDELDAAYQEGVDSV